MVGLFIAQYRSICVAEWLDYIPCPIQNHLGGRVVGLFLVQYRSTWVAEWLDYIPCQIQKHLCSQVVGLYIVQYRSICVAKWLVLWTSGQATRKFSRRKTDGIFLTFPRKYDLTFHANCIQKKEEKYFKMSSAEFFQRMEIVE